MKRFAVGLAALGLMAAAWVALLLSQSTADARAGAVRAEAAAEAAAVAANPGDVPGFRADAWYLPDDELLGFVEIRAGPFTMGSDPAVDTAAFGIERWSAGAAQGVVDLPRFYVARYEVTVAQYSAFVRETGHPVPELGALAAPGDYPVTLVSWTDAVAYARWLTEAMAGRTSPGAAGGPSDSDASAPGANAGGAVPVELGRLLAEGWRVRLPTEAEWEKAARGTDGRIYPWGDEPRRDRATFLARSPTQVGTYGCAECPYELYDMAGNVWEWTRSPYQPYPFTDADDRADLQTEALWVMRGGSFSDPPNFVRAANRGGADPGARRPFIGFRVVLGR